MISRIRLLRPLGESPASVVKRQACLPSLSAKLKSMDTKTTLSISAKVDNLEAIRRFVQEAAQELKADQDVIFDMLQAVDESATNIIQHGYGGKMGNIEIAIGREDEFLVVHLRDQAPPFDPTTVPPPDLTLPLEKRPFGGMGVYLTMQFMDKVIYRVTSEGGNELILMKTSHSEEEVYEPDN